MEHVDTIIVGMGLAGCGMYWSQKQAGLKCLCIDPDKQNTSSHVAAGMFNPIVGKRFTTAANAHEIFDYAKKYYTDIERLISKKIFFEMPLYMPFQNIAHQNDWSLKQEKLKEWINDNPTLERELTTYYKSKFGGFFINKTGYLNSDLYINSTLEFCKNNNELLSEHINYNELDLTNKTHRNYQAKHIVFCEGAQLSNNPFIKQTFLNPAKGQLLWGQASSNIPDIIYNGKVYIVPTGNNQFICGATYEWVYIDEDPNDFGREYLLYEFNKIVNFEYTIIDHKAAIRPTVIDRKPVVGIVDKEYNDVYILNGLGTKGVILAPTMANIITQHIINKIEIPIEFSISRFDTK